MSAQVDVLGAIDALVWIADQEGQESEADAGRQARADVAALIAERDALRKSLSEMTELAMFLQHRDEPIHHQPAPVVDDARMARALEWARDVAQGMPASAAKEHLPAIEEAIAAYDPNCGARTVRVAGAVCNWRQQDEDGDHISTSCGHEFILNDAGDYEDGRPAFPFCCYCSKPTMFHRWRDEPECSCDHSDGDAPECEGCADRRNRAALARAQGVQS